MNVFQAVKSEVTTRRAAEHYGVKVKRNGMACCVFHPDKNPSLKVDERFYCFGCGAKGDVIDFVGQLFGLESLDAALKLANDFSITYDSWSKKPIGNVEKKVEKSERQKQLEIQKKFEDWLCSSRNILIEYRKTMEVWHQVFKPKTLEEHWNPLFQETLENKAIVDEILDMMFWGSKEEQIEFYINDRKVVEKIEKRMERYKRGIFKEIDGGNAARADDTRRD